MLEHYRKRLHVTVGSSAAPYGFTLATWTTGAVLAHARGIPDALAALTFVVGAPLLPAALVAAWSHGGGTGLLLDAVALFLVASGVLALIAVRRRRRSSGAA